MTHLFRNRIPGWWPAFIALWATLASVTALSAAAQPPHNLDIPLVIESNIDPGRESWPVRGSVPLPPGLLQPGDITALAVIDAQGRPVPAQFAPFARWWGRDGSVKWLLVDLLADVPGQGRSDYRLVRHVESAPPAPASPLHVNVGPDSVTVVTGPLKAVISKTRGTILEEVRIDRNGDGRFTADEQVIRPDRSSGSIVTSAAQDVVSGQIDVFNMWGTGGGRIGRDDYAPAGHLDVHTYTSGGHPPDMVVVESSGPVRATVRIEGRHMHQAQAQTQGQLQAQARDIEATENGIRAEGFYHYTVRLHFHAGMAHINVEHSLDNDRREFPLHMFRIDEARLQFALNPAPGSRTLFGLEGGETARLDLGSDGLSLLQDSANKERWDLYHRLEGKSGDEAKEVPGYFFRARSLLGPAAFRGYKVVAGRDWPTDAPVLEHGDQAPGWGAVDRGADGISLFLQNFWIECPKALRLFPDKIEAVFLPDFSPELFHVHPGTRKTHALTLGLHPDTQDLEQQVRTPEIHLHPLVLRTEAAWNAASGAYPRHIGAHEAGDVNNRHWYPHYRWDRNVFAANWKTAGMLAGFNSGGMHANYWSRFHGFLRGGGLWHWERGRIQAKWAATQIPWLIRDYTFTGTDALTQHRMVGWGPKQLVTYREATQVRGWVTPYTTPVPVFTAPAKTHMDGEHLIHIWPLEWYYLTGSPLARQSVAALGNQAKYSTHRNFFRQVDQDAPSLEQTFYFDDENHPERIPRYFYTRIYASHLLSTAWAYAATGDEASLFYARWLARRILYLQQINAGVLSEERRWRNIAPWQEAEAAIAASALYRETGDKALLDIMGSWLEWAWNEAYEPGKGMPHRFPRGERPRKFEHHWYPGVAAPLVYAALGDPKALEITRQWADSGLPQIKKGEFLNHPAGQSAAYVLTYLVPGKATLTPPPAVDDLEASHGGQGRVVLSWTAPRAASDGKSSDAARYWVKIADQPIVDHPAFPEELGQKRGFYQADNVVGEPVPAPAGTREMFSLEHLAPHGAYGATTPIHVNDLAPGTYYFAIKSWDADGNLSPMSNVAHVTIEQGAWKE